MRKHIFFLFCWMTSSAAWAQTCEIELDTLLERYVATRGGDQAMESQTALRLQSTNHEGKWNPEFDYRTMKPGYMWIEARYDDGEVIIEGFDGERGWEKWGSKPAEYVSGAASRALNQGAQSPVHLYGLHHMEELGAKIKFSGCDAIEGRNYYVINVRSNFGTTIDYYLDQKSYLLERSRTMRPLHPTVDPAPIVIEERWSDFRMVDGVLHPFALNLVNVDTGERISWLEVHLIERDSGADANTFRKPK